jgi:hypothetical protein
LPVMEFQVSFALPDLILFDFVFFFISEESISYFPFRVDPRPA